MELIYNSIFLEHDTGNHPENKSRLLSLGDLPETEIENGEKYLTLVHTPEYIEKVKETCKEGGMLDADTIASRQSYEAAIYAVGATVLASEIGGFALVRPPGHHAYPNYGSGFCLFNNIAIAVQKLINEGKKVLIFDFDGHLGDGTETIFYNSNKALFWSLHLFPAFPGTGDADEIGSENGRGYTINVPLPTESGDDVFFEGINTFLPAAKEFNPDVVAISAGFDAHQSDFLLRLRLSLNAFYKIGRLISSNFDNVFATLEGGYNTEFLPKCIYNFLDGINNEEQRFFEAETDSWIQTHDEFEGRISLTRMLLSKYWKSIKG